MCAGSNAIPKVNSFPVCEARPTFLPLVEVEYSGEALVLIKILSDGARSHIAVIDVKDRWPFTFVLRISGRLANDRLAAWEIDEVDISPARDPPQRASTQQTQ